jgi:hypothetical protein
MPTVIDNLSDGLVHRVQQLFGRRDAVECIERRADQLVVDHKFPMIRWGGDAPSSDMTMSEEDVLHRFQLLKKDSNGNHNLLKSRACERCKSTGSRGTPLGIRFWYRGGVDWPAGVPDAGQSAKEGCVGCGWYDFAEWRQALNKRLDEG